jgi:hypothetical protein
MINAVNTFCNLFPVFTSARSAVLALHDTVKQRVKLQIA